MNKRQVAYRMALVGVTVGWAVIVGMVADRHVDREAEVAPVHRPMPAMPPSYTGAKPPVTAAGPGAGGSLSGYIETAEIKNALAELQRRLAKLEKRVRR